MVSVGLERFIHFKYTMNQGSIIFAKHLHILSVFIRRMDTVILLCIMSGQ